MDTNSDVLFILFLYIPNEHTVVKMSSGGEVPESASKGCVVLSAHSKVVTLLRALFCTLHARSCHAFAAY